MKISNQLLIAVIPCLQKYKINSKFEVNHTVSTVYIVSIRKNENQNT